MGDVTQLEQGVREMQRQETDLTNYRGHQIRIDKAKRIHEDIRPSDGRPFSKERVSEIRNLELSSDSETPNKEGLEALFFDARGYQETRFRMNWVSPDGKESTPEDLVMFVKAGEGEELKYLTGKDGNPIALNADLYESILISRAHAQGKDSDTFTIPRVDNRGAYTGVVHLMLDKSPE